MRIEIYRTNHNTSEAQKFSKQTSYDYEHLINFTEFILHRINSKKINKTDSKLTRFIFSFCFFHERVLKFYRQQHMTKTRL